MSAEEFLVMLNVPVELEESMVDCLLSLESEDGFSSFQINSHDHRNIGLSLAEQVAGRQRKLRFQFYLPKSRLEQLQAKLRKEFTGSGIHFWIIPMMDSGYL